MYIYLYHMYIYLYPPGSITLRMSIIHLLATVEDSDSRICRTTCLLLLFPIVCADSLEALAPLLASAPGYAGELHNTRS